MNLTDNVERMVIGELKKRTTEQQKALVDRYERFDNLQKKGLIKPDRYDVAPISPIAVRNFAFSK